MAVNDDQLVERLVPKVLSGIRAKAKAVESVPIKQDLSGITSLPAYDTTGGQYKNVLVPLNALKEPAVEAAERAMEATTNAINATNSATQAAKDATDAAEAAQNAAIAANEFANKVVVLTEEEYDELLANYQIDDTKIYYTYDPETE